MQLEDLVKKIDTNIERIDDNARRIEENFQQISKNSCSLEILKEVKGDTKMLFVILVIVLVMWFLTIGYLAYVLNDAGTETSTIDIDGVEEIDNSHIKIGDDIWEKSE